MNGHQMREGESTANSSIQGILGLKAITIHNCCLISVALFAIYAFICGQAFL